MGSTPMDSGIIVSLPLLFGCGSDLCWMYIRVTVDEAVVVNDHVNQMSTASNGPRLLMKVTEVVVAVVTVSNAGESDGTQCLDSVATS